MPTEPTITDFTRTGPVSPVVLRGFTTLPPFLLTSPIKQLPVKSKCVKLWSHYTYGVPSNLTATSFSWKSWGNHIITTWFCDNHSILWASSDLSNNFNGIVNFFQKSQVLPYLGMTLRWPRSHPRHLSSISRSLCCNPGIFEVFQSPLHPHVMTTRSYLHHLTDYPEADMTERLSNITWWSLGHLKVITRHSGVWLRYVYNSWTQGDHLLCDHNLQNRAPKCCHNMIWKRCDFGRKQNYGTM